MRGTWQTFIVLRWGAWGPSDGQTAIHYPVKSLNLFKHTNNWQNNWNSNLCLLENSSSTWKIFSPKVFSCFLFKFSSILRFSLKSSTEWLLIKLLKSSISNWEPYDCNHQSYSPSLNTGLSPSPCWCSWLQSQIFPA